jgi:hypothetical protein
LYSGAVADAVISGRDNTIEVQAEEGSFVEAE